MSTSATLLALLAQCKHEPTANAPRLVLADWLLDNGQDALAEFVRLQLSPDPLEDHWEPESAERQARQRRLLREHAGEWFGLEWATFEWCRFPDAPEPEDPGEGDPFAQIKPVRGLLELHTDIEEVREHVAGLPEHARPWLENLHCLSGDSEEIASLLKDPVIDHFSQVGVDTDGLPVEELTDWLNRGHCRALWLVSEDVEAEVLTCLAGLSTPRLRKLDLSIEDPDSLAGWERFVHAPMLADLRSLSCRLPKGDDALTMLAGSTTITDLRELLLFGDRFGDNGLTALFNAGYLANLTSLKVSNWSNAGSRGLVRALAQSTTIHHLEELELSAGNSRIDRASLRALGQSPVLERLGNLQLDGEALDGEGLEALLTSPLLGNLERLTLRAPGAGDRLATAIARSSHLGKLRALELISVGLGEEGVRALAAAPHLDQLESLDLSLNRLSNEAVQELASSRILANLRELGLRQTPLTANTWRELREAGLLRRLVDLDLQNAHFGPEQARALVATPLPDLRELTLCGNRIGDAGVRQLASAEWLPGLIDLNLESNRIGDKGLEALLEALPGSQLAQLDLSENRLTDVGARALLQWPGLPHLVELGTYGNKISLELERELHRVVRRGPHG
jgi:uncharacterized protein (TIGR02996 family)